jgi:MoaA/NifB/PqqE/SkfB family radical SAM enzyme
MGDLPASVHVEISNVCNLNCEYCVLDQNAEGDRTMSAGTFSAVLPFLRDARRIDVSGIAEPLMNTRWPDVLRDIRDAAPHARIAMCSNMTLLTREKAEVLVDSTLDELTFSLDGVDPALVDHVRRGGSLTAMLENIRTLQAVKTERESERPELTATVVLQRSNVEQLPDIVRLAADLGVQAVNVNGLEPYAPDLVEQPVWTDPGRTGYLPRILDAASEAAAEAGVTLRLTAMSPGAPVCPQIHRPMVLADGSVVPCSVLAYERRSLLQVDDGGAVVRSDTTTPRVVFGSVNKRPFKEIWTDPDYRAFRARVSRGDLPDSCDTCLLKHGVICPTPPLSVRECLATLPSTPEIPR